MHELETFHLTLSTAVYFIENKYLTRLCESIRVYIEHNLALIQVDCNGKF